MLNKTWWKATLIRAVKTFAECMLGYITIGATISEINWVHALSASAVATLAAVLWAVKGLPEVEYKDTVEAYEDGALKVRSNNSDED